MSALVAALAVVSLPACVHAPAKESLAASSPPPDEAKAGPHEAKPLPNAAKPLLAASAPRVESPKLAVDTPAAVPSPTLPAYGNVRPSVAASPAAAQREAPQPHPAASTSPGGESPAPSSSPHGPAIYSAKISPSVVHNGEAMTWSVRTTADVVSVTAHVSAYTLPLRREKSGLFSLSFTVPSNVPGFFHGSYSLDIIAQNGAGSTATRTLPLIFQ